jgi:hypothetical protein
MTPTKCFRFTCFRLMMLALISSLTMAASGQSRSVHIPSAAHDPDAGIFPSDFFTVPDIRQRTGLRINLPLPDCTERPSDCYDIALINQLDGFNLQTRVTVPFDGDIDPSSVNSNDVFFVELGDTDGPQDSWHIHHRQPRIIGINQAVWDGPARILAVEADEQLEQHTLYAFVVTTRVLDASGAPIQPARTLFHALSPRMQAEIASAWAALHDLGLPAEHIAGLSVFTTQSATAVLEHIRDQVKGHTPKPASFDLGAGGSRTVFSVRDIQNIDWQQQIKVNPPAFQAFKPQYPGETNPLLLLDRYKPGAVGRIAYGKFESPRYIGDEPIMPPVGTRHGIPPVQQMDTLYLNVFLPAGSPPPGGWPVVIFGLGGGDYKEEMPYFFAAAFASHGMATACINVVGQAYGPLSFLTVTLKDGSSVQFPAGGRGKDINGDGIIANNEGVSTISPAAFSLGARDTIRQQAVDMMQLVRVIQSGIDVDGDGIVDLNPSRISYFGISFGAGAFGQLFLAIEPDLTLGAIASPGGLNSRFDLLRMRPSARSQVGTVLHSRVPSLLNSPGLTEWGGIPVGPPLFNENIPLRDQPIGTDHVAGAMDIQKYFDNLAWISNSGDGAIYAPYIRKQPLPGVAPKSVLINFGKGDVTAPNPRTTQILRASNLADVTTYYRNDLAYEEDNTVSKNPHTYTMRWMLSGLSGSIGQGGLEQIATFLASSGVTIVHPEPARFFEVPIIPPLPEDFSYIP